MDTGKAPTVPRQGNWGREGEAGRGWQHRERGM